MKRISTLICAIIIAVSTFSPTYAADYTLFEDASAPSYALPISYFHTTYMGSITQQIYLAEELIDAGASSTGGDINAITFYYTATAGSTASAFERDIKIWLMAVPNTIDEYPVNAVPWSSGSGNDYLSNFQYDSDTKKAGIEVFSGKLSTAQVTSSNPINFNTDIKSVTLGLSRNFPWDGSSNIVMTVADVSNESGSSANLRFLIASTVDGNGAHPRFVYTKWPSSLLSHLSWVTDGFSASTYGEIYPYNTPNALNKTESGQKTQRSYVNKITFSISTIVAPSTPTGLSSIEASTSSITLSWNAASSATAYDLQYKDGESWIDLASDIDETSYTWTELTANTSYEVRVRATNSAGNSDWSDPVTVSTEAIHEHNSISFEKWSSTNSLPTAAGNYYLSDNVSLTSDWNVNANINLCLNGHSVYTETNSIQIKDGATLAIYDNEGTGSIYGYFVAEYPKYGLINIETGGTLVLSEGKIQNLYGSYEGEDDPDDKSLSNAIYNNGTLKLSGAPVLNSYNADLYLGIGKVITIESEKPLTNTVPFSVYKSGAGAVTSGWANMNGADPRDYLVSANNLLFLTMGASEAEMKNIISLSETSNNTAIETYSNQLINVRLTRSLTSAQYNTFCLPFALTDEQMQEVFGEGYDLEELTSSSLNGDLLNMIFTPCTNLEAGKPYLLQPAIDVENPTFEGVTITETEALSSETDYIDFKAIYSPTWLTDGDESLLFLGADNTLFSPAGSTDPMKGFRGYFETKNGVKANAIRAHITKKTGSTTGIGDLKTDGQQRTKVLRNGQLLIIRGENTYNAQGQLIK